jgi:hypothetical protein
MDASNARRYGLVGGFPGDEEKLAGIRKLASRVKTASPDVHELIGALDTLPFSGRVEFMLSDVCESPARDKTIQQLFDACFVTGEAQTAGVTALGGSSNLLLDPQRFAILRLIIVAVPCIGQMGVELFEAYQKTTSTVLMRLFLSAMIASPSFSDDKLEAVFVASVDASRQAILQSCKEQPHRRRLLGRLVKKELAPLSTLSYANPEAVDAFLGSAGEADVAAFENLGFANWKDLSAVYLAHFRRRLQPKAKDPIALGKIFRELEGRSRDLRAPDVVDLFKLCDEYQPLELTASVNAAVREYLEQMSQKGALNRRFEGVVRVLPSTRLVTVLRPEDKLALLKEGIKADDPRGFVFSESHAALCDFILLTGVKKSATRLLFLSLAQSALGAVSEKTLWQIYTGAASSTENPAIGAFQSFGRFLNLSQIPEIRLTSQIVTSWLEMHRRSMPTPEIVASFAGKKSETELWTAWTQHAVAPLLTLVRVIARKAAYSLDRTSVHASRSSITSYVNYLRIVVEDLQLLLCKTGQKADIVFLLSAVADIVDTTRPVFARASEAHVAPSSVAGQAVDTVRASVQTLVTFALERCSGSLLFNPAVNEYVFEQLHPQLAPLIVRLTQAANLSYFPGVPSVVFSLCDRVFEQVKIPPEASRLGFVEIARVGADGGKVGSFVHFQPTLHKTWSTFALELLSVLRTLRTLDDELAGRVWARYKLEKYGAKVPTDKAQFGAYLEECRTLPASCVAGEKPELMKVAVSLVQTDAIVEELYAPWMNALTSLGWLNEALAGSTDALRQKVLWNPLRLIKSGDLATPGVRELLQEATSNREPQLRIEGHLALLNRSVDNASQLSATFSFVAQRTKNEAGLHRPALYQWMNERMRTIVDLFLREAAHTADAAVAARTLTDVETLCSALERMLIDDTSKRDTVAKNAFRTIAGHLFASALTWDPRHPVLEARRRFIVCACELEHIVLKALGGEQGPESFVWPIDAIAMSREGSVPEHWLEEYRIFLEANYRAGVNRFDQLRAAVYTQRLQREQNAGPRFDLVDAIDFLLAGVVPSDEFSSKRMFPVPVAGAESTLFCRAKALFRLAGSRWTEVPRLVNFLQGAVSSLDASYSAASVSHARQLHALLNSIRACYPAGSSWFEIVLVAQAYERLLEASIRLPLADVARAVYPVWMEIKMGLRRTPISVLGAAKTAFLVSQLSTLNTDALREVKDASDPPSERRAACARFLLEKTPSAAYIVVADLLSLRDDLLVTYVRKTRGELQGVFDPAPKVLSEAEARERAPIFVDSALWVKLNSPTMRAYTRDSLEEAMTPSRTPQSRSDAIARFVTSPASSHVEIIELLGKLTKLGEASAAAGGAAPAGDAAEPPSVDDPGRELLLETVILCVFQTDAAWFVLSYLLSPEVVKASQVRTTASILSNLHKWVPVEKVVAVLRVLLEPQRRWALRISLQKSIVRMLFEAASNADARAVFVHEWTSRDETRMHIDIVYEMVKLAVSALSGPDAPKLDIAWKIVSEVARSQPGAFNAATLLLLLLPTFAPPTGQYAAIDGLLRIAVPPSEVPDSFGFLHPKFLAEAPVCFSSDAVREKMIVELRSVATISGKQNAYLRIMATCKEFTLSRLDDESSLERLQELVLGASVRWASPASHSWDFSKKLPPFALSPEDEYFLQVASRIYSFLALQSLSKATEAFTEHERRVGVALERLCESHASVSRLRSVMAQLLESLARVAPVEVEKRVRLSHVARGLLTSASEWGAVPNVGKVLFSNHFQGELAFLRGDAARVTGAIGVQ